MIQWAVRWMEGISPVAWRWIALLYFVALTTGTHWPKLRVGAPGPIPLDKILHTVAFCGLSGLLMLTRLLDRRSVRAFVPRNIWRCTGLTLALAAIDEITQAIPGEDRFPGWDDYAADVVGITIALLVANLLFSRVRPTAPDAT